jgi:Fe-S cluster assembly iron-binding protein IscA
MLTVTRSAKQELNKIASRTCSKRKPLLRLIINRFRKLALVASRKRDNDYEVKHQGETVLVASKDIAKAFDGLGIDYSPGDGLHVVRRENKPEEHPEQE